jgi:hypothetical protein
VIVMLEPDALALQWGDSGCHSPTSFDNTLRDNAIKAAVTTLHTVVGTNVKVFLDAAHSAWYGSNVPGIVDRLVAGGIAQADGFFTNASNYRSAAHVGVVLDGLGDPAVDQPAGTRHLGGGYRHRVSRSPHRPPVRVGRQRESGNVVGAAPGQRHSGAAVAVVVDQPPVLGFHAGATVADRAEADQVAQQPRPAQLGYQCRAPLHDRAGGRLGRYRVVGARLEGAAEHHVT